MGKKKKCPFEVYEMHHDPEDIKKLAGKNGKELLQLVIDKTPVVVEDGDFAQVKIMERLTPATGIAAAARDVDNLIVASTKGGIERQEARGQDKSIKEETLPIRMNWEALEKIGFKRGKDQDELFRACTFPKGWRKLPFIDHSMWNYVLDGKGRIRGSFFYKAAFYDRDAFGHLESRYWIETKYLKDRSKVVEVLDRSVKYNEKTGRSKPKILFKMKVAKDPDWKKEERAENLANFAAAVFLAERFPGWDDVTAYWD